MRMGLSRLLLAASVVTFGGAVVLASPRPVAAAAIEECTCQDWEHALWMAQALCTAQQDPDPPPYNCADVTACWIQGGPQGDEVHFWHYCWESVTECSLFNPGC